ncbi:MAG: protein kinase domain-containing protein [Permianibacter sp.]
MSVSAHGASPSFVIPGYRMLQTLGQGGMATVYLAVQESVDRQVALKVMAPELAQQDKTYGERFLREARIVAKLVDPHIVTIYDVGISDGRHYLAMEYVPGRDLRAQRCAMTLTQCLTAVKQIALALHHAHHQGYIHRDIKPENILIHRHNGRAILTDFGIAKPVGADDEHGQVGALGTPSYMSPEQALGQPLDHRSDLYSLGIVSYFVLTGQAPFTGDSPVAISMKHALDAVPRLPPALALAQPLIDVALAKHPDQRFQSGQQFAEAIDALLQAITANIESSWRASLNDNSSPEATRLSMNEPTRVPATAMSVSSAPVVPTSFHADSQRIGAEWSQRLQHGAAVAWEALLVALKWFGRCLAGLGQLAADGVQRVLPVLKRGGAKMSVTVSEKRRSLWANRAHNGLPLFTGIAALAVLLLWWLLSDDWNRKTAREAYQDGELTKAEYNEILAELKKEHQAKLAELREALEDDDLTREEFVEAVKKAKQEYSGEDDCGSWLGC